MLCSATRKDGRPCTVRALPASAYCFAHDPGRAEQRRTARAKGGRGKANAARLGKMVPPRLLTVYDRLEQALTEVHDGTLDPKAASAMAALAGAMVRALTAGEMEERLRKLEESQPAPERSAR